ncbi:MAG TPA: type II secretion system secretin GspD [Rhodoblastus sp.]|nr:type II secretion system secretin GspD [Rhodoblastus sp.]
MLLLRPRRTSFARRLAAGATIVGLGALLASCNLTAAGLGSDGREAVSAGDAVRNVDLEPRFPRGDKTANSGNGVFPRGFSIFGDRGGGEDAATTSGRAMAMAESSGGGAEVGEGGVTLNFENAPVAAVAKVILGDALKVGYTIDPRVQGSITLSSGRAVPRNKLLYVLESALKSNGMALVRDAHGYSITPAGEAMGTGVVDGGNSLQAGYGVTVIPLRYVSAQTVVKLLEGFSVKPGAIKSDSSGSILIVAGSAAERRMALDTVANFDADWMRGQSVGVYPLQSATPEPIVSELEKILDSGEGGMGQGLVKFQAISRLNAILVVAKKPELLRNASNWIRRLDGSSTAAIGVKVYHVRHGEARHLAQLLNEMFLGGQLSLDNQSGTSPSSGSRSMSPVERLTGGGQGLQPSQQSQSPFGGLPAQQASLGGQGNQGGGGAGGLGGGAGGPGGGAGRGGLGGLGRGTGGDGENSLMPGVRITADTANNSILIYANQANYKTIERALIQLDRPRGQVAIELTIAEVTLNDKLNYGVQFFLQSSDVGIHSDRGSLVNTAITAPLASAFPGFNFLAGSQANPRLIINALHGYTDVKVLSNPSLVVVDNQPATLQVGDQVPVQTGNATVLSTSNTVVSTVDYKNTGIILRVLPRITSSGSVTLDVEQEISSVPNSDGTTQSLTPTISERKVKSTINVMSGQTVLLAGLISNNYSRGRNGIPVLDQVPVVGDLFTQQTKGGVRTELIVFIKPQIIRDPVEASVIASELRAKMSGSRVRSDEPPGAVSPRTPRLIH